MYKKICKKLNIYIFIYRCLVLFFLIMFCYMLMIFIKTIYKNYNEMLKQKEFFLNKELMEKPIIQINDEDNNLIYIEADSANIKNSYKDIKLNNTVINSNFVKGASKTIIFNGTNNELILKDRPELIFYNIDDFDINK